MGFLAIGGVIGLMRAEAGIGVDEDGRYPCRHSISSKRSLRRCSSFVLSVSATFPWVALLVGSILLNGNSSGWETHHFSALYYGLLYTCIELLEQ